MAGSQLGSLLSIEEYQNTGLKLGQLIDLEHVAMKIMEYCIQVCSFMYSQDTYMAMCNEFNIQKLRLRK